MSRYTHLNGEHEFVWGFDTVGGWFIQVFDLDTDEMVFELDTLFDGIDFDDILEYAELYEVYPQVLNAAGSVPDEH